MCGQCRALSHKRLLIFYVNDSKELRHADTSKAGTVFRLHLLHLDGDNLQSLPLVKRKERLRRILPSRSPHVLYVNHTRTSGTELYRLCCQLDLEGIVAKRADSPMRTTSELRTGSKSRIPTTARRKDERIYSSEQVRSCKLHLPPSYG